jgi:uridylate kinase
MMLKFQKRSILKLAGRIVLGAKGRGINDPIVRSVAHNLKVICD